MTNNDRVQWFLNRAGLHPPLRLTSLVEPAAQDFLPFEATNRDLARQLLVQQRKANPNFTPPERQIRHIFRSKDQKAEACNSSQWSFTKHEVAKAFDALLSQQTLPPAGVAQALLLHTTLISLDELWGHFNDPQLEKKMKRNRTSLNASGFDSQGMTWLDKTTSRDNFNYILLLCQTHVSQPVIDRALGVALSRPSLQAIKLLLSFGAKASTYQETISHHVRARNLDLISLLLSAPNSMTTEAWRICLEQELARAESGESFSLSLLLLLLSNRAELVSESLLLSTLRLQNFQATAVVLAYASSNQIFFNIRHRVSELVSAYQDDNNRPAFFTLLAQSGLVSDNMVVREELFKDVSARCLPLVKLFVQAGVSVDADPHNSLQLAVSSMDFEVMDILRHGTISFPPPRILDYLPQSVSEQDMIQFLKVFGSMGLAGQSLDSHLITAVQKRQRALVETLLHNGASPEYEQGSAIRITLKYADLYMLNLLLLAACSSRILSTTIPEAMEILPRSTRLSAMTALVRKGVEESALGTVLHNLMSEDDRIDSELVELLVNHGAKLGHSVAMETSPVLQTTRKGDIPVLTVLLRADPDGETLAAALPVSYQTIESFGKGVALEMMNLLLKKGASGTQIHETLLSAVTDDQLQFVATLVNNGADINYSGGAAFARAAKSKSIQLLELLCSASPPKQETVDTVLPVLIDAKNYSPEALELFLSAASRSSPRPSLRSAHPLLNHHPLYAEILPRLLRHGLDVDEGQGLALRSAIQEQNMDIVNAILALDPNVETLCNAFDEALKIDIVEVRLDMMRRLLDKASPEEIGQSRCLLKETITALDGSMYGLSLLLDHKADVNYNNGEAVQAAASSESGYPILLNMLLSAGATNATVEAAFKAAGEADTSSNVKIGIFGSLFAFNKKISVEAISKALANILEMHPGEEHLPQLLLEHGATVNLHMLESVAVDSSGGLFQKMITHVDDVDTRNGIFQFLLNNTTMDTEHKYQAINSVLEQGVPITSISDALSETLSNNSDEVAFPKLLLDHGAAISHNENAGLIAALKYRNLERVMLLCGYLRKNVDDEAAKRIFEDPYLRDSQLVDPVIRAHIYSTVLVCNIDTKSLSNRLIHTLESNSPRLAIVRLLLENGANPNDEEGHCFYLAARHKLEPHFRELCKYAETSVVLPTLLRRFDKERHVTRWFRVYFEERKPEGKEIPEQILFQCIRKFQDGDMLLGLLLDQGMSPGATITYRIRQSWPEEEISLLIWTLVSPLRISNMVIFRLLEEGRAGEFSPSSSGQASDIDRTTALLNYITPLSRIPTIFLTLLDRTREPVLKMLLKFHDDETLHNTISGSTFSDLAEPQKKPKAEFSSLFEDDDEISPREASMFLGNLGAFKLLNTFDNPDDGTLHLAALLALPDFVTWLLQNHEPNYEEESFGFMVPLALTCYSKPFPWCKVASDEKKWLKRLEETMRILIPKTFSGWRYRRKHPLHLALDNGAEITETMLRAMDLKGDIWGTYSYTDKTGKLYSPCEYVETFVEVKDKEKTRIAKCLQEHGLE
ncbi:hypothetical protein FHETE_8281 [Fusarium heterosporum]|uniref:Ankyrin repeat protein n=1 Tax=Fusarium heterosporum TaxID=42747 RepID=A0A8H5T2P5_FUSHE|nr:hypothetical protein FHETE_8281 [Fusarium heterosporum]